MHTTGCPDWVVPWCIPLGARAGRCHGAYHWVPGLGGVMVHIPLGARAGRRHMILLGARAE